MAAGLVSSAQCDDGYINSYVQAHSLPRYENLRNGHEHYCMGHLIQAAVAARRATGDDAWLGIATSVAGHLEATFGADLNRGLDGHPVIESALVELFRCTGDRRHLELARWFVEARGHATISPADPSYYTDARPAAEQDSLLGHAVRALYFDAGVVDVAVETGDQCPARRRHPAGGRHDRHQDRHHRRSGQPALARVVRRPVRAAARPGIQRDLRGDREHPAVLAAAAGHR